MPMFMYIGERLAGEKKKTSVQGRVVWAMVANYIVCEILIRLGNSINLLKPSLCALKNQISLDLSLI